MKQDKGLSDDDKPSEYGQPHFTTEGWNAFATVDLFVRDLRSGLIAKDLFKANPLLFHALAHVEPD